MILLSDFFSPLYSKALGERVSYFYEGLETEVTYQLPIDQEEIRKEIVRNFMRLNSLEYQNAINQLIRLLLKDKIAEGNIRGYSNGTESR
ncbi:hypothetical protein MPCS_01227 [Candidatus Megaera polyxenophila]|nr:hypothetical protein MPCS_01227 [Candidatus Megaera polyxenophila]